MGLMFGYNPPLSTVASSGLSFLRAKAGTATTVYSKATELTFTNNYKAKAVIRIHPSFSKRSTFTLTFQGKNDTAGSKHLYLWAIFTDTPVTIDTDFGGTADIGGALTLPTRPASGYDAYCPTALKTDTTLGAVANTYEVITVDIPFYGFEYLVLVYGGQSTGTTFIKNQVLSYAADTPEPTPSKNALWEGVL